MSDFSRTAQRRHRPLLWGSLLLVLLGGGWLWFEFYNASPPPVAEPQRPQRTVTLYFASLDGSGLVAEGRQLTECRLEEECLRTTIEALAAGPAGQLAPVLPSQTVLRGVSMSGGEVTLDFSRGLVDSHPGGSFSELLTVYGLADTVAVNFPQFRQLRLLIEGAAVETLKGHVDLRLPLVPDFSLLAAPSTSPSAGGAPGKS